MIAHRDRLIDGVLLTAVGLSIILAGTAFFGTGVYRTPYGIRLSSQTLWRPAVVGLACGLLWLRRSDLRQQRFDELWRRLMQHSTLVAVALAIATGAIAVRESAFDVYAADVYGYVSEAHLWAAGRLTQHDPLALAAPWPDPEWTLAPLGYRPGLVRGTIVPTYPPGLPLVMAALLVPFGPNGVFYAVPLLGAVAVFTAFVLGRRVGGPACGLAAAALLLTSPIFLYQLREPMSDVPVTAWWLLALVLVSSRRAAVLLGAGFAAGAAIVTRPNLVPLAAVLGLFVLIYSAATVRGRLLNALSFSLGVVPACVAVAMLDDRLYGSPFVSGYGNTSDLFARTNLVPNFVRYSEWLFHSESLLPLLAVPGFAILVRRNPRWAALFAAFAAVLYGCYALYVPFDNWTFLRFLLPAIPLLLILCSVTVLSMSDKLRSSTSRYVLAACLITILAWRWDYTGLTATRAHTRRFAVLGEYVRDQLPPNAIVFSIIHAGSVRYYSGRSTLRWDWLRPEWFDRSLAFLSSHGYHAYLLVEESEQAQFKDRFASVSKTGSLGFNPVATYHDGTRVDVYDLADPSRTAASAVIDGRGQR